MAYGIAPALAIKVDVDTHLGLLQGAPKLLEILARQGVRATWFVAMGPDRTGRAILRVFRQRGFLKKMLRSGAPRLYPLTTMLRGTLLPSVPIAASAPQILRDIRAAGHEIGVHGWDHVAWHDRLGVTPFAAVRAQVDRARQLFEAILGEPPAAFAAPGWQCTGASLRAVDELGFRYRSDTRGTHPYRPVADGYRATTPEIPTTLPTLDEILGATPSDPASIAAYYDRRIGSDVLNVHTIHTEVEGSAYAEHFERLLAHVKQRVAVRTLREVAGSLPAVEQLDTCDVRPGILPGRGGSVACQAEPGVGA